MMDDRTILPLRQSEKIDDPLTEIAREGARRTARQQAQVTTCISMLFSVPPRMAGEQQERTTFLSDLPLAGSRDRSVFQTKIGGEPPELRGTY
jgi:hypothetical protein